MGIVDIFTEEDGRNLTRADVTASESEIKAYFAKQKYFRGKRLTSEDITASSAEIKDYLRAQRIHVLRARGEQCDDWLETLELVRRVCGYGSGVTDDSDVEQLPEVSAATRFLDNLEGYHI